MLKRLLIRLLAGRAPGPDIQAAAAALRAAAAAFEGAAAASEEAAAALRVRNRLLTALALKYGPLTVGAATVEAAVAAGFTVTRDEDGAHTITAVEL